MIERQKAFEESLRRDREKDIERVRRRREEELLYQQQHFHSKEERDEDEGFDESVKSNIQNTILQKEKVSPLNKSEEPILPMFFNTEFIPHTINNEDPTFCSFGEYGNKDKIAKAEINVEIHDCIVYCEVVVYLNCNENKVNTAIIECHDRLQLEYCTIEYPYGLIYEKKIIENNRNVIGNNLKEGENQSNVDKYKFQYKSIEGKQLIFTYKYFGFIDYIMQCFVIRKVKKEIIDGNFLCTFNGRITNTNHLNECILAYGNN